MRYLCIHSHFYQPARENPWLETIEAQDSAAPWHDWNERVTAECYAPNGASRILDSESRISKIVNNYARISFNFGPTLLSWLETHNRETYDAILEGDRESRRMHRGHGGAIAQIHGHVIMPLANRRDKETQVVWGIRDFRRRFGREPEGMWLPETAVDIDSLEVLARHGIRFTILAPHQAARVRDIGATSWRDVSGGRIDPSVPYLAKLPSGRSIALFFYDGPIARAVAFERLLHHGHEFGERLMSGFPADREGDHLVHIATDGETYGHHHRFGDMALAWVLERCENNPDITLTNYGEFLEICPPVSEVEIVEKSSWSCAHGIERWRSDCGCSMGGPDSWKQNWREPLRAAFDWLRDTIAMPWEEEGRRLFRDPWEVRNEYVEVVGERSESTIDRFLDRHMIGDSEKNDRVRALEMLELQRWAMLMYTSCGWFFSDITGIETVQVIQYAARVVQLGEHLFGLPLEEGFRTRLARAPSNLSDFDDGREVYDRWARPAVVNLAQVAAHDAIASLFEPDGEQKRVYAWQVTREEYRLQESGSARLATGIVRIDSTVTCESSRFEFAVLHLGDIKVSCGVRESNGQPLDDTFRAAEDALHEGSVPSVIRILEQRFSTLDYSVRSLFRDDQRRILAALWQSNLSSAESAYEHLHQRYRPLIRIHADLGMPLPLILRLTTEASIDIGLMRALGRDDLVRREVETLVDEVKRSGIRIEEKRVGFIFEQTLTRLSEKAAADPSDLEGLRRLDDAIALLEILPFTVSQWRVENHIYDMLVDPARQTGGECATILDSIAVRLRVHPRPD